MEQYIVSCIFLDETLEMIYEDKKDLRNAKLEMIQFLSRGMIE